MITKAPKALKNQIKQMATDPKCGGTLHQLSEVIFDRFLSEKPYKNGYQWAVHAKDNPVFNILVSDALTQRVKLEAAKREVPLSSFLLTALTWWVETKGKNHD